MNPQAGTQYTVAVGDLGELDTFSNNAGGTIILPGGSLLPNKFSAVGADTGAGTTLSASVTPYFANSAVFFVGSCSAYASQTGIVPSGSGWAAIDAAANANYASIYTKLIPGVSSITETASITATAWAESLLVFQNVNKLPTVVQSKILGSGAFINGESPSGAFNNPVTKGNLILVLVSAGAITNDVSGNPTSASIAVSDGVNSYGVVVNSTGGQDGGHSGPQAGYSCQQVVAIAENVAGGSTTVTVNITIPGVGSAIGTTTITAYEISLGTAPASSTGFTPGWYCYIQNTGSGSFSVTSDVNIDGSASPVSLGSGSGLIVAFDGTNWFTERGEGGGGGSAVTSWNTRTGAVTPQTGDYTAAQVTDAASINGSGYLETSEFPALTGDVNNSAGSLATTVTALQGNAVKSGVPSDANVLTYVAANTDWEPKPLSALGGANASQLRGNNISSASPASTQFLQWNSADSSYDLVYDDYQAYSVLWEEDFLTSRATTSGPLGSPYGGGGSAWTTASTGGTSITVYAYNQFPSHMGVAQIVLPSSTANLVGAFMPTINGTTPFGAGQNSTLLALLDNPGWECTWIFQFSRAWGEGTLSSTTPFSIAHTMAYIGFAAGLNNYATGDTWNNYFGCRPNIFLGVRYDTDTGVSMSVSAVGSGTGVYTVSGGSAVANFYAGSYITFANCGNAANNGTFMVKSSTSTSLTTTNSSSVTGTGLSGTAVQASLNDSTFKLEYVANPFPFAATATTAWRNNNSGTVTYTGGSFAAGTVYDTSITPVEGTWYRLDMVCASAGSVKLTLSGGGSTASTTITCGTVSYGDASANWTYAQANGVATAVPGTFALLANGTNIQTNVWGPGSIITVTTPPTGLTTPFTMVGQELSTNGLATLQSGALTAPLTKTSILTGYPAMWPMVIFGNDQAGGGPSAGGRALGIDFFGMYYNPAIAGHTYSASDSRYFTGT